MDCVFLQLIHSMNGLGKGYVRSKTKQQGGKNSEGAATGYLRMQMRDQWMFVMCMCMCGTGQKSRDVLLSLLFCCQKRWKIHCGEKLFFFTAIIRWWSSAMMSVKKAGQTKKNITVYINKKSLHISSDFAWNEWYQKSNESNDTKWKVKFEWKIIKCYEKLKK